MTRGLSEAVPSAVGPFFVIGVNSGRELSHIYGLAGLVDG